MIDFIKLYDLKMNLSRIHSNVYLKPFWNTTLRDETGEILVGSAKYRGCNFLKKFDKIRFEGSIHKYFNNGEHNHNDFYVDDVMNVIKELKEKLEVDIYGSQLCNIEIGVNVLLPFPVEKVLNNIIAFKGEPFNRIRDKKQDYCQCVRSQFIIKIYNKSLQYGLSENLLRFEVKVLTMQFLRKKGVEVRYLSDLLNPNIYEPAGNILTEIFDEIIFNDDTISERDLVKDTKELCLYLRATNPKNWKPKDSTASEWKRLERMKLAFKALIEKHRKGLDFRVLVADLIREKSMELAKPRPPLLNVSFENVHYLATEKLEPKVEDVHYLDLNYNLNQRQANKEKIKLCSGCGKPIEKNRSYHSLDCYNRKLERNARSNPKNNFKNSFSKKINHQPFLFEISEFIKLTEHQKEWINFKYHN